MSMSGFYSDGTEYYTCPEGVRLYYLWDKTNWRDTPPGEDVFDNPEGREYWAHRDSCPECTKRKGGNDDKEK